MSSAFTRACVIITMLLSVIGQSLANTVMPCEMTDSGQHMTMNHTGKTSTSSSMAMHKDMKVSGNMSHGAPSNHEQSGKMDCCDIECSCPANACSTYTFVTVDIQSILSLVTIEKVPSLEHTSPISIYKSFYRPPIIS
ncbi:hypothetical protein [Psychrosphaera algicola]|uniref:CopL family metal-binding regulatory protein n=1 Tax=Psychrosphaera algicola TaxID=3023714 RepID=A0ABT5FAF6_9GAMM|nr:hypothetical protein [Psychrosphaera sp. G1-22]MDC2887848.1 hypothetical protein [Psychrosphaera sp. G1-22]